MSKGKEVTMKSDDMAKSWVAQMASQTMGMILESRRELSEKQSEYQDDLDWHRMRIEELEEEIFALQAELENEKIERAELETRLRSVSDERNQFKLWWKKDNQKIVDLQMELASIKKSDAGTSDKVEEV